MTVDFVTGGVEGNTVILTIVHRLSKMVHFVPLPKLPAAFETANLLILNVSRLHGMVCFGCNYQPVIQISFPVQWPDGMGKSGLGVCTV